MVAWCPVGLQIVCDCALTQPFIGAPQPFYQAQFRDPLSPNSPNDFGLTVPVTELSGTAIFGDSGGPLWIQTMQGLLQIGVTQGGDNPFGSIPGQYGSKKLALG
jgi:hypothetical protein